MGETRNRVDGPAGDTPGANVIAITGADGFIGRHLARHFRDLGWSVRGLVRNPDAASPVPSHGQRFRCALPDDVDPVAFSGARVVVHAAYATRHRSLAESRRVNEEGTSRVLELARQAGAERFVFFSSTSAHAGARSYYARSKLAAEETLDLERDLILRCGLVLGADGGLFHRLVGSLRRSSFVPVFDAGRQEVQTVHVDDLCRVVQRCIDSDLRGRYVVAHPDAVRMSDLLRGIATRLSRPIRMIPIPLAPATVGLRALERFGIRLAVSSENLLGLKAMRTQSSEADLARIGVELRPTGRSLDDLLGSR